jgi:AraC family transcriptional regulator of arabinose operon
MIASPIALYRSSTAGSPGLAVTGFGRQHVTTGIVGRRLPSHAVVLVERGRGTLRTEKAGLQAVEGPALFWLLSGKQHSYSPIAGESWDERWALFSGRFADELIRQRLIAEATPLVQLKSLREMQQLFATLHLEFAADTQLGLAASAATLHRIIVEATRQATPAAGQPADAPIERAIEALQQRAFQPVDMAALSDEFAMSPATLRRRFAAATGLSPKAFQLRLRIDHAKQLLTTSDLTIEAISLEVGIDDAFYFSRLFQDRERCAPSEFRRRHRRP